METLEHEVLEKCDLSSFESAGHLLIFNHYEYDDKDIPKREGTAADVSKLTETFTKLGYQVHPYKDLTVKEIEEQVEYYSTQVDFSHCASLAVFVLTHGHKDGYLEARDMYYYARDMWQPFLSCSSLQGKLKWFGFQACRGDLKERRFSLRKISTDLATPNNLPKFPQGPDLIVSYCTFEEKLSYRHEDDGAWYIQTLCDELAKFPGGEDDLVSLLTRVNRRVLQEKLIFEGNGDMSGQTPVFMSFSSRLIIASRKGTDLEPVNGVAHQNGGTVAVDVPVSSDSLQGNVATSVVSTSQAANSAYKMSLDKQAIIYHDKQHQKQARILRNTLCSLNFKTKCQELTVKIEENITSVATSMEKNTSCMLVAVLANLEEDSFRILQRDFPMSVIWKPFMTSKCPNLASKPKLFLYIDNFSNGDSIAVRSKVQADGPASASGPRNILFTTDNSDMLFVRGYGQNFASNLFADLELSRSESLIKTLTRTLVDCQVAKSGLSSHFESSLQSEVIFSEHQEMDDEEAFSTEMKDNIQSSTADSASDLKDAKGVATAKRNFPDDSVPSTSSSCPPKKAKEEENSASSTTSTAQAKKPRNKVSTTSTAKKTTRARKPKREPPPELLTKLKAAGKVVKIRGLKELINQGFFTVLKLQREDTVYGCPMVAYMKYKGAGKRGEFKSYLPKRFVDEKLHYFSDRDLQKYNEGDQKRFKLKVVRYDADAKSYEIDFKM